jgi:hypothetical protein
MIDTVLKGFFSELEKIAFTGSMLKSPIAKQLVSERKNWRAAKGIVVPQRKPTSLLQASQSFQPSRASASPEQSMMTKLRQNMQKPSGAKQAADADRVAAAGRGYGRAITSVE